MKNLNFEIIQNELTFGVEFECCIKTETKDFEIGGYHHGIQVPSLPNGWKAERDGSVHAEEGYTPVEIVSPILNGRAGIEEVMAVADILKNKYKATVNRTTGFHVHIGLPSVLGNDFKGIKIWAVNLISWVGKYEAGFYASTGTPYRTGNTYCKSVVAEYDLKDYAESTCREFEGKHTENSVSTMQNNLNHDKRYNVLNLNPLFTNSPNVEFRVFQGTVESLKVASYVQMCLGFVLKALQNGKKEFDPIKPRFLGDKGTGEQCIHQMFNALGWQNCHNASIKWAGFLLDVEKFAKPIRAELRRLARKFDCRIDDGDYPTAAYQILKDLNYFN